MRLLLTDSSMPGMTGSQAAAEIRKFNPSLPVIIGSGELASASSPTRNSDVLPEMVHISKPFSLEEVLTAIGQSLRRAEQEKRT